MRKSKGAASKKVAKTERNSTPGAAKSKSGFKLKMSALDVLNERLHAPTTGKPIRRCSEEKRLVAAGGSVGNEAAVRDAITQSNSCHICEMESRQKLLADAKLSAAPINDPKLEKLAGKRQISEISNNDFDIEDGIRFSGPPDNFSLCSNKSDFSGKTYNIYVENNDDGDKEQSDVETVYSKSTLTEESSGNGQSDGPTVRLGCVQTTASSSNSEIPMNEKIIAEERTSSDSCFAPERERQWLGNDQSTMTMTHLSECQYIKLSSLQSVKHVSFQVPDKSTEHVNDAEASCSKYCKMPEIHNLNMNTDGAAVYSQNKEQSQVDTQRLCSETSNYLEYSNEADFSCCEYCKAAEIHYFDMNIAGSSTSTDLKPSQTETQRLSSTNEMTLAGREDPTREQKVDCETDSDLEGGSASSRALQRAASLKQPEPMPCLSLFTKRQNYHSDNSIESKALVLSDESNDDESVRQLLATRSATTFSISKDDSDKDNSEYWQDNDNGNGRSKVFKVVYDNSLKFLNRCNVSYKEFDYTATHAGINLDDYSSTTSEENDHCKRLKTTLLGIINNFCEEEVGRMEVQCTKPRALRDQQSYKSIGSSSCQQQSRFSEEEDSNNMQCIFDFYNKLSAILNPKNSKVNSKYASAAPSASNCSNFVDVRSSGSQHCSMPIPVPGRQSSDDKNDSYRFNMQLYQEDNGSEHLRFREHVFSQYQQSQSSEEDDSSNVQCIRDFYEKLNEILKCKNSKQSASNSSQFLNVRHGGPLHSSTPIPIPGRLSQRLHAAADEDDMNSNDRFVMQLRKGANKIEYLGQRRHAGIYENDSHQPDTTTFNQGERLTAGGVENGKCNISDPMGVSTIAEDVMQFYKNIRALAAQSPEEQYDEKYCKKQGKKAKKYSSCHSTASSGIDHREVVAAEMPKVNSDKRKIANAPTGKLLQTSYSDNEIAQFISDAGKANMTLWGPLPADYKNTHNYDSGVADNTDNEQHTDCATNLHRHKKNAKYLYLRNKFCKVCEKTKHILALKTATATKSNDGAAATDQKPNSSSFYLNSSCNETHLDSAAVTSKFGQSSEIDNFNQEQLDVSKIEMSVPEISNHDDDYLCSIYIKELLPNDDVVASETSHHYQLQSKRECSGAYHAHAAKEAEHKRHQVISTANGNSASSVNKIANYLNATDACNSHQHKSAKSECVHDGSASKSDCDSLPEFIRQHKEERREKIRTLQKKHETQLALIKAKTERLGISTSSDLISKDNLHADGNAAPLHSDKTLRTCCRTSPPESSRNNSKEYSHTSGKVSPNIEELCANLRVSFDEHLKKFGKLSSSGVITSKTKNNLTNQVESDEDEDEDEDEEEHGAAVGTTIDTEAYDEFVPYKVACNAYAANLAVSEAIDIKVIDPVLRRAQRKCRENMQQETEFMKNLMDFPKKTTKTCKKFFEKMKK